MIHIDQVFVEYHTRSGESVFALHGASLDLNENEVILIAGANGSGKSTLIQLLNGIMIPTRGNVLVDGMNTRDDEKLVSIRRIVAMVFQDPDNQLVAPTVEEDIAFGLENFGTPPDQIRNEIDRVLDLLNLSNKRTIPVHRLSLAEKQIVAIAGAIVLHPKYLILDEPTSHLDWVGSRQVSAILQRVRINENITLVVVTHRIDEFPFADRLVILQRGRVVCEGPYRNILYSKATTMLDFGVEPPPIIQLAIVLENSGLIRPTRVIDHNEMFDFLCRSLLKT